MKERMTFSIPLSLLCPIFDHPHALDLTLQSISAQSVCTCASPTDYSTSWPFLADGAWL